MIKTWVFIFLGLCIIYAQYPIYDQCPNLTDSDFTETQLFGLNQDPSLDQPMRMDLYQDTQGNINVYFIERAGKLKYYDGALKTVTEIGQLNVFFGHESGLLGVALDPDFETNGFIYFYWSPSSPSVYRLSRFSINRTTNRLVNNSEVVMMDLPDTRQGLIVHTGGALHFDVDGNLWGTVGEHDHQNHVPSSYHSTTNKETSNEDASTDTYSLYGGVFRIHPEPDGSYTIPKDNFGEYWSRQFNDQGRNVLSTKYADTTLVKPELYAKGFRNPMSVTVDPVTKWAAVSECGGQCHKIAPSYFCPTHDKSEKHMVITEPSFHGWAYFHADNHPYVMNASQEKDPLKPVNNSPFRLGVDTLPPATPGTYIYGNGGNNDWICNTSGTVYRYNWANPSSNTLPPHFDGKWLITDMNKSWFRALTLDSSGNLVSATNDLFNSVMTKSHTLDLRYGPDGALYFLNYAKFQYTVDETTGLFKMEYNGNCRPKIDPVHKGRFVGGEWLNGKGFIVLKGSYQAEFFSMDGSFIYSYQGTGKQKIPVEKIGGPGVYQIRVTSGNDIYKSLWVNIP